LTAAYSVSSSTHGHIPPSLQALIISRRLRWKLPRAALITGAFVSMDDGGRGGRGGSRFSLQEKETIRRLSFEVGEKRRRLKIAALKKERKVADTRLECPDK